MIQNKIMLWAKLEKLFLPFCVVTLILYLPAFMALNDNANGFWGSYVNLFLVTGWILSPLLIISGIFLALRNAKLSQRRRAFLDLLGAVLGISIMPPVILLLSFMLYAWTGGEI